jgi:hypothetical protein
MKIKYIIMLAAAVVNASAQFIPMDNNNVDVFLVKYKSIKINIDSVDDVINKLGNPTSKGSVNGLQRFGYAFKPPGEESKGIVNALVNFDNTGKVLSLKVVRTGDNEEELYSKGGEGIGTTQNNQFPVKESAPQNPVKGQIYFNSSDSHFYGWNGKTWVQLDTKP